MTTIPTVFFLIIGFCGTICTERDNLAPFETVEQCEAQAAEWRIVESGGYFRCDERSLVR